MSDGTFADPVGEVTLRFAAAKDKAACNAIAYAPATLQLARLLAGADPAGYEALAAAVRSVGVRLGPWEKRVRALPERPAVLVPHELEAWLPAHPHAALEPAVLRCAAALDPAFRPRLETRLAAIGIDLPAWRTAVDDAAAAERARAAADAVMPAPPTWLQQLRCAKDGTPLATFGNVCLILRHAPEYAGRLVYDEMGLRPCLVDDAGVHAPLSDAALGRLREDLERRYDLAPHPEALTQAILTVAHERAFHPVRAYLGGLSAWDGEARLDRVAREILGATDPLAALLVRRFLIAAVARACEPGCKVDCALVLVGDQGWFKSWFFRALAAPWFGDSPMDIEDKDSLLKLHATWFYEWAEIENVTSRKKAEAIKAFLTIQEDLLRPPYARAVQTFPRAGVIVGTTNRPEFLNDPTGDRRFWIVDVGRAIDRELLAAWRDQLWAEALAAFRAGERWWLDAAEETTRAEDALEHHESDAWEPLVALWLAKNNPAFVSTADVLTGALEMRKAEIKRDHESRVGAIMLQLRWEKHRPRRGAGDRKRGYVPPGTLARSKAGAPGGGGPPDTPPEMPPVQPQAPVQHHGPSLDAQNAREERGGPTGPTPFAVRADTESGSEEEGTHALSFSDAHPPSHPTHVSVGPVGPGREVASWIDESRSNHPGPTGAADGPSGVDDAEAESDWFAPVEEF